MKQKQTTYLKEEGLIITSLSGEVDHADVDEWHSSLRQVLNRLESGDSFKILVDLHGFKAVNFEVHKKYRVIIPSILAEYGWYIGYLRMFPETNITIHAKHNIRCVAAAHVHHDEGKIKNYADNYTMMNERFFTSTDEARSWIQSIRIPTT